MLSYRLVAGSKSVLLATDVAAQGLDISAVEHAIHYQLQAPSYAHVLVLTLNTLLSSHSVMSLLFKFEHILKIETSKPWSNSTNTSFTL